MKRLIMLLCMIWVPAAANPVTLDFTGTWHHWDDEWSSPTFHAAMRDVGVDNGTPISWSLFLDDVDLNPDPVLAAYSVFGSSLSFGSLSLATGPLTGDGGVLVPSTLAQRVGSSGGWSMIYKGTMGAPVEGFFPEYLQFGAHSLESGGVETPIGSMDRLQLIIGFNNSSHIGSAHHLADTTLTSVAPIPEPEIYAMLSIGLGLVGWVARRKKLHQGMAIYPAL